MKKKCITKFCRNKPPKNKKRCYKCASRIYRGKYPLKAAYYLLKSNAKRRNKFFDLTLKEFTEFCREYDYIRGKGKTKTSFTVDCIINSLGYTKGNLQVLPLVENSRKGKKVLEYDYQSGHAHVWNHPPETPVYHF